VTTEDGVVLHVEVDALDHVAPTVVFVSGINTDLEFWSHQRRALAEHARMVLFDHRGHGRSGATAVSGATIEQLARDLREVLLATSATGPTVLVAHSMGGLVVAALGELYPEEFVELVDRVVLIDSVLGDWARFALKMPRALARPTVRVLRRLAPVARSAIRLVVRPARAARLTRFLPGGPDEVMFAFAAATALAEHGGDLRAFHDRNTLIIAGEDDSYLPLNTKKSLSRSIRGASLIVVPRGGHLTPVRRPAAVSSHLRTYLDTMMASPRG